MHTFPSMRLSIFAFGIAILLITGCSPAKKTGCAQGGNGVFSPEDVRCYLDKPAADPAERINDQTLILYAEPESISEWAGAAILFHEPTGSIFVLDPSGIPLPDSSRINQRAGLAELAEVVTDPMAMAGIRQKLAVIWGAPEPGDPEIRLGIAWQSGPSAIFMIAVAGLEPEDGRFYCPSQTWMIGEIREEVVVDCVERTAGSPVNRVFFEEKIIAEKRETLVTLALDGVLSNEVRVRKADAALEYQVYTAALSHLAHRPLIVRGQTVPGFDADLDLNGTALPAELVQNFQAANEVAFSLRFLLPKTSESIVLPDEAVFADFLQGDSNPWDPDCSRFRNEYSGLGGVVGLSRIGFNSSGTQALVHLTIDCGAVDKAAEYILLEPGKNGDWAVVESFQATAGYPKLIPQMDYRFTAQGCGDIFVYVPNKKGSEYLWVSVDARNAGLSPNQPLVLNLADKTGLVGSQIYVFPEVPELSPFCNDVSSLPVPQSVWEIVAGVVTVHASAAPADESCEGEAYVATIKLENAIFRLGSQTVELAEWTFKDVQVGWCPG